MTNSEQTQFPGTIKGGHMITVSLRSIAKALQGATDGLFRTALVLAMALAFSAGAQVLTKDTLKAAEKQIATAAAEQKDATKALEKTLKIAREATADFNAAKQHLADLEAQLAKAPADAKAKLAAKVQAAKDEVMELDAARAKTDGAVTAARQRLTTATQKTLDAEAAARSLDGKYADQKSGAAAAEAKRVADEKMAALAAKPVAAKPAPAAVAAKPAATATSLEAPVAGAVVLPTTTSKLTGT